MSVMYELARNRHSVYGNCVYVQETHATCNEDPVYYNAHKLHCDDITSPVGNCLVHSVKRAVSNADYCFVHCDKVLSIEAVLTFFLAVVFAAFVPTDVILTQIIQGTKNAWHIHEVARMEQHRS